jgi:hypothetical protein
MKVNFELEEYKMTNKQYMSKIISEQCVEKADGYFFGKMPGTRYSSQFYLSRALYNTDFLNCVAEEFYKIVENEIGNFEFQIAGQEFSSIPLLVSIPILLEKKYDIKLNSFMIKNERKTYGIHNYIEGNTLDLPVLIIGEMCNSTNTFLHCHNVLKYQKFVILPYIFAVLNKYGSKFPNWNSEDRYLKRDFKPLTILNRDDLKI